jgi:hypothetical protein
MPSTNDTSGSSHCLGHPHHGLVYGKNSWPDTALFFHGKIHGKSRCRDSRRAPHWVQMVPQWIVAPQYIHPAWRCLVKPLTSGFFLWDLTMGFNYELIGFSWDFYEIYMVTIVRWEKNMGFSHRTMIFQPCTHISHIYIYVLYTHTHILYIIIHILVRCGIKLAAWGAFLSYQQWGDFTATAAPLQELPTPGGRCQEQGCSSALRWSEGEAWGVWKKGLQLQKCGTVCGLNG